MILFNFIKDKFIKDKDDRGSILLDAVFAVFLLAFGFASLYGLTNEAIHKTQQAKNLTDAANIAVSKLEYLSTKPTRENLLANDCIPGESVYGQEGRFNWVIRSSWEIPNKLLRIQVEVCWQEKKNSQSYTLETLLLVI